MDWALHYIWLFYKIFLFLIIILSDRNFNLLLFMFSLYIKIRWVKINQCHLLTLIRRLEALVELVNNMSSKYFWSLTLFILDFLISSLKFNHISLYFWRHPLWDVFKSYRNCLSFYCCFNLEVLKLYSSLSDFSFVL